MSAKDGGPAFPVTLQGPNLTEWTEPGMTLRDYFAAKAMQGLLAAGRDPAFGGETLDSYAREAYRLADAMLKARAS